MNLTDMILKLSSNQSKVLVNKRLQYIYEDTSYTMTEKLKDVARKMTHVKQLQETYEEILLQITEENELNSDIWCFYEKLEKLSLES